MRRIPAPLIAILALAACSDMPRDAAGTTERIERSGVMRVAVLPGTPDEKPALLILSAFARSHRAAIAPIALHGEHALHELEEGRVDAVVGHFAKASPWQTGVALSEPVYGAEPDDEKTPVLRIARRNGENGLILATDRAVAEQAGAR